ncbi:MAG: tRNA (adenosine(37)-N6)-threonylcarbamoyltransferase complex dimerization subunit type 1 TsaB [Bacillota bacterium]|nr:tRNA (adenosine(37)-N6)-threonylcarbamoyltransferase complex dimerization subunit type 1 TsaB [Bacillota bacterium]
MKILAIDSSSTVASVAVSENEKLLGEYTVNHKLTHSQRLLPMIDELLKSLNMKVSDIDVFAVSSGPGSFTGLRIGIATVKGLAFVENKPTVAVSGLEAMAYNQTYTDYYICPIMDARHGQVYNAVYKRFRGTLKTVFPPEAIEIEKVISRLNALGGKVLFMGDGVLPNLEIIKTMGKNAVMAEFNNNMQRGASVALAAWKKAVKGEFTPAESLNALYLRKSQAEREFGK